MAKKIFIAATMQNDGKTTVSLGLIAALKKRFEKIGFIKPIGQRYLMEQGYKVDEDSILIEKIFGIRCNIKDMSPVAIDKGFTERFIEKGADEDYSKLIKDSFDKVAKENDLVIIEDELVDFDRHFHGEQAIGERADVGGGEGADLFERGGIIPGVVVEDDLAVTGAAFFR